MKIKMMYLMIAVALATACTGSASASGSYTTNSMNSTRTSYPFEGEFSGYVFGDHRSKARITLKMSQNDEDVSALVHIGEGLYVDAGICGAAYIPTGQQTAQATIHAKNPEIMSTTLIFSVKNLKVSVDLSGEISTDGKSIHTQAIIDLPWLCGRDPVIQGTLYRVP